MAIADTITSMQTHTSNAYTMIGYGTDLTGINKNLENLSTSIFNAFLEALRTPDTLFTNLPKKSGTGANITLNDTANAPMRIELGASELSQAGTPTPDSPQDIHTISGSNKVVVRGTQLFDGEIELGGIDPENGNLTSSTTRTRSKNYIKVEPNTTYTLKRSTGNYRWIIGYDKNKIGITDGSEVAYPSTVAHITSISIMDITFTTTSTTEYIKWYDTNSTDLNEQVMINVGSTAIPYEPYKSQEADIDLGVKNELEINNTLIQDRNASGLVSKMYDDGTVWFKGTATTGTRYWTSNDDNKQLIKAGTYTLFTKQSNSNLEFRLQTKDAITSTTTNYTTANQKVTFTTTNDFYIYNGILYITNGTSYDTLINFYLIKGDKVQEVSDNPIEYGSIGNYEDKFIRQSDGTWELEKNIGKVVLDGTENWGQNTAQTLTNTSLFYTALIDSTLNVSQTIKSNYFNYTQIWSIDIEGIHGYSGGNDLRIRINTTTANDVASFKTWLSTHNTIVYYVLNTPTYTPIKGTLANQLENVYKNMLSQAGQTNISQENNDLSFELSVQAIEDIS